MGAVEKERVIEVREGSLCRIGEDPSCQREKGGRVFAKF